MGIQSGLLKLSQFPALPGTDLGGGSSWSAITLCLKHPRGRTREILSQSNWHSSIRINWYRHRPFAAPLLCLLKPEVIPLLLHTPYRQKWHRGKHKLLCPRTGTTGYFHYLQLVQLISQFTPWWHHDVSALPPAKHTNICRKSTSSGLWNWSDVSVYHYKHCSPAHSIPCCVPALEMPGCSELSSACAEHFRAWTQNTALHKIQP